MNRRTCGIVNRAHTIANVATILNDVAENKGLSAEAFTNHKKNEDKIRTSVHAQRGVRFIAAMKSRKIVTRIIAVVMYLHVIIHIRRAFLVYFLKILLNSYGTRLLPLKFLWEYATAPQTPLQFYKRVFRAFDI